MSEFSTNKIAKLESLSDREKRVLDFIMSDPNIKVIDIVNSLNSTEGTIRGDMTNIFKKLGVPEGERDKRGFIIREYSGDYRERYLKVEIPSTPKQTPKSEPVINRTPQERRPNRTAITIGLLAGFLVISVCAIGILVVVLFVLNRTPTVASTPIPPVVNQVPATAVPQIEQPTSVPLPTEVQATAVPTPMPTPAPKEFYSQGEGAMVREGISIALQPDFIADALYDCVNKPGFVVQFGITNRTSHDFLARYDRQTFSAVDDTGKTYQFKGSGVGRCDNTPGPVTLTVSGNYTQYFVASFYGEIPLNARYIYITINDISGSGKIVLRKDL